MTDTRPQSTLTRRRCDPVDRVLARAERRSGVARVRSRSGAAGRDRRSHGPSRRRAVGPRGARTRCGACRGLSTELEDVTEVEYRQLRLENVVLVGVYPQGAQDDAENSLRELAALAETAGAVVLDAVLQRRPASRRRDLHRPRQGAGAARHRRRRRRRHRDRRHRARPEPASRPRGCGQGQGHRPHDRDPRHLQPARQEPRGQGAGRARAARVPAAAPARLGRLDEPPGRWPGRRRRCRHGIPRTRRDEDRARSPPHPHPHGACCARQIRDFAPARDAKRAERKRNTIPSVAIAGYTNAGKSSLLNRLTSAGVLVENALFATLDATVRRSETDRRARLHAHRHRRVRAQPSASARRGVPVDARRGRRRRCDHPRRRRRAPRSRRTAARRSAMSSAMWERATSRRSSSSTRPTSSTTNTRLVLRGLEPNAIFASSRLGRGHRRAACRHRGRAAAAGGRDAGARALRAWRPGVGGARAGDPARAGARGRRAPRSTLASASTSQRGSHRSSSRRASIVERLDSRGLEAEDLPEERELGLEGAHDGLGAAEPVTLALEREVGVANAIRRERVAHRLGLRRRHHVILESLLDQQRQW